MALDLDELIQRVNQMPKDVSGPLMAQAQALAQRKWLPSPGPQTDAYLSDADVLLYGGAGGGGKSSLLIGLALNEHHRSLILRRKYADLSPLTEESVKFNGTKDGFTASPRPRLKTSDGRLVEFGAAQYEGDEQSFQGSPHDFIGFDEAVHFSEQQVRFIMGWLRTTKKGQRCRVVMASNPPVGSQGMWVIEMFAPWLDPTHPNPAEPGELRWFVTDGDGKDKEVLGPEPIEIDGEVRRPLSRTFISARLQDNPFLKDTNYQAQLDALPEPLRSAIRDGNFMAAKVDQEHQIIPTAWVMEAVKRWTPRPPAGIPQCAMGVDCSGGGTDPTVIAIRHDGWFAPLIEIKAEQTPHGQGIVGYVISNRRDNSIVVVDMGGGYGSRPYQQLQSNNIEVVGFQPGAASAARVSGGNIGFKNKRAEIWWKFREALDPNQPGGSPIMLPNDPQLIAELTAPVWEPEKPSIVVEGKEDIKSRLGRSTDRADAVLMAWWQGARMANIQGGWIAKGKRTGQVKVNLGHENKRRH